MAAADYTPPDSNVRVSLPDGRMSTWWFRWFVGLVAYVKSGSPAGIGGISVVITTAALTPAGAQGSMTFVNGVLTAQTQAT